MLKVVGASWLQTRISTYILIVVAVFGIGAIILGEFGHVENDGTYSATVSWNHKGGYRIDFWGQGNNLADVRLNAARAYYKTGIPESGWSIIEIETSSKYPDTVQAYAAGLLEGSLTWQLIHHHWRNTVNSVCEKWANECRKLMWFFQENNAIVRKRAELLAAIDPFWHMVRLFYIQLDGLEAGWKFAVHRSRQTVEMDSEHFLWLAMAGDLPDLEQMLNGTDSNQDDIRGMIFLKSLPRKGLDPLIAIGHTTVAPYVKMLRLVKKYTFGYHILPKIAAPVPGKTIVMSSYPGALSSHDEFYLIQNQNHELIVAGIPLATNYSRWNFMNAMEQNLMPPAIMAANHLATNGQTWFQNLSLLNNASKARQWITFEPRGHIVQLVEQLETVRAIYISERFANAGAMCVTGKIRLSEINMTAGNDTDMIRDKLIDRLQRNVTTMEHFRRLMRGYSHEESMEDKDQMQILNYRGDLEQVVLPFGVIDAKIVLVNVDSIESFEAFSGPSTLDSREPFRWSKTFPNISHIGQPDAFNFDSVTPLWVWL